MEKMTRVLQVDPMLTKLAIQVTSLKETVAHACATQKPDDAKEIDVKDMQMAMTMAEISARLDVYAKTLELFQVHILRVKNAFPSLGSTFTEFERIIATAQAVNADAADLEAFMASEPSAFDPILERLRLVETETVEPMRFPINAASVATVRHETDEHTMSCKTALIYARGHIATAVGLIKQQRPGYYSIPEVVREAARIKDLAAPAPTVLPEAQDDAAHLAAVKRESMAKGATHAPFKPTDLGAAYSAAALILATSTPPPASDPAPFQGGGGQSDGGGASGDWN